MTKVTFVLLVLFISGCASQEVRFDEKYGKVITFPEDSCSIAMDKPSIGLIYMDYNSEYNIIKFEGVSKGVVTNNVILDSPSDLSEFPLGVVITSLNGQEIEGGDHFIRLMRTSPSSLLNITYIGRESSGRIELRKAKFRTFSKGCSHQLKFKSGTYKKIATQRNQG